MVKVLCYKSEGRWFDLWIFHWHKILPIALWPWGDSASNRNEHQKYLLGGKGGRCVRLTTYHHPVPLSRNLGTLTSLSPLGHSRPVMGLFYLYLPSLFSLSWQHNEYDRTTTFHAKWFTHPRSSLIAKFGAYSMCTQALSRGSEDRLRYLSKWSEVCIPVRAKISVLSKTFRQSLSMGTGAAGTWSWPLTTI